MDELSKALDAAPREAAPSHDLWPAVESRIERPRRASWQQAAAALVIFGAGALAGALVAGTDRPAATPNREQPALHRVAELQRAGSDYVAAVARLRDLEPADARLRAMGYEAALGVVAVAAQEVSAAVDLRGGDDLVGRAHAARDTLSERTTGLVQEGLR